jgi:hypothetical protein
MGWGAALGLMLGVAALVAAVTGVHATFGLQGVVDYLLSPPVLAFDLLQMLSEPARWIVLVGWYAAVGAAFGFCLREGGDGWFAAVVLAVAIATGHAL